MCVAEGGRAGHAPRVSGVPLLRAFAGGALCDNARTLLRSVPAAPRRGPDVPAHAHAPPHADDSQCIIRYDSNYFVSL